MNMKNLLLPTVLGAVCMLGTLPLSAATQVATYPEAEAKGLLTDDGIILFAYADGWDKFSKKRCEELMNAEAIRKAAGKAVMIPLPIPAYTTDESKARQKELCGKLEVPHANSYPALLLLDRQGKHYATLCGTAVTRGKVAPVAKLLADRMAKGKERTRLLAAAEKATGPEKARHTYDAYQLEGLTGFGRGFAGHIAKLDPQNATGLKRATNYDHYGLVESFNKMQHAELMNEVNTLLADAAYTNRQKQQICVAAIGALRRNAGPVGAQDLQKLTERMKAYAPETWEGKAADFILREWVRPFRYDEGWTPATVPPSQIPTELVGELPIKEAGTYTVRFDYTRGAHAFCVLAVELYDGKTKVAEDHHKGTTGTNNSNNTYTLKVSKAVADPHLMITVDMKKRDSYGTIAIQKQ